MSIKKKISSLTLFIIVITYTMAMGAAHLAIHMGEISEETLNVSRLFSPTIKAKFEIPVDDKLVYSEVIGVFKGVKLIMQVVSERIVVTDIIVENTIINLLPYGFEVGTSYELCIKPYYDFGVYGIKNVAEMSEYNFNNYTIKSSEMDAPTTITIIF